MKRILFTALTLGSSLAEIAHSNAKLRAAWDEPSSHELIGAKAEDVYYFDDVGNLLGHFGQEGRADRIRHVAGMDVDTEVPAAKLMTDKPDSQEGLAEASSASDFKNGGGGDAAAADDDEQEPKAFQPPASTPEEKVARVAVTTSEKYKR